MLLTGMFFHTGAESFAACLIVFFLFAVPLYKCTYYDFALKMMFPSRSDANEDWLGIELRVSNNINM